MFLETASALNYEVFDEFLNRVIRIKVAKQAYPHTNSLWNNGEMTSRLDAGGNVTVEDTTHAIEDRYKHKHG